MRPRVAPGGILALVLAALLSAAAGVDPLPAQELGDDRLSVEHFLDWERASGPRISPDGSRIVYTRSHVDRMKDRWQSEIWIMEADGSGSRFLVEGSSPRWSPDGTRIAYLAEGDPKGAQIHVLWLGRDGGPTQVTRVTESPQEIRWGPDGERISFLMHVPDEQGWPVDIASPPEGAEWTQPPQVVHRIHYRADGRGNVEEGYTHLFTVPATGGTPRQITEGEWNVGARFDGLPFGGGYDWTPDGSTLVFDGYGVREGDPDRNYRTSHIYAVDLESREIRRLTETPGTWSDPVVSPDGETVAFTGFEQTELTYHASDLWALPVEGDGDRRKLTGELDRDAQDLFWAPDGGGVYFTAGNEGAYNVWFAPADGSGPRRVTEGDHAVSLEGIADDGTAVAERATAQSPQDVVRFQLPSFDGFTQLTAVNEDVLDSVALGAVEEIEYESADGTPIQGWIVKPPGFESSEDYPMVLFIHGGPHAMYDVGFSWIFQNLAANGYVVLYTNPRGSTGYGTDFGAAISQDYPSVDHQDLMAGVDEVLGRGYVDADRLMVGGCSGGGVLSSWAITQTDRFAAAAVLCPVIDWISMAGTTDIPLFTHNFFDVPFWEDPTAWLEHSSLMHVEEVDTPTLLATGRLDLRTPITQTEEFYQALKMEGVPTVMLRFQEEYHGIWSNPSNFMRAQRYIIEWFDAEGEIPGITAPEEESSESDAGG